MQVNHNTPTPLFFVSVESKGLSDPVSSLNATLMGDVISVAAKGLREGRKWECENGKWASVKGKELGKKRVWSFEASKVGKFEGQEEMENEGGKGRRSFLRRAEGEGEYNAKGTGCQCLFSV
jgi:hypothetical protein